MEVLICTIFFSVMLAVFFLMMLVIASAKGWMNRLEQDSLLPLREDAQSETSNPLTTPRQH